MIPCKDFSSFLWTWQNQPLQKAATCDTWHLLKRQKQNCAIGYGVRNPMDVLNLTNSSGIQLGYSSAFLVLLKVPWNVWWLQWKAIIGFFSFKQYLSNVKGLIAPYDNCGTLLHNHLIILFKYFHSSVQHLDCPSVCLTIIK